MEKEPTHKCFCGNYKRYGIHGIIKQLAKLNSLIQECKMKINRYWIFEFDCNGKNSFD